MMGMFELLLVGLTTLLPQSVLPGIYDSRFWHDQYVYLGHSTLRAAPAKLYLSKRVEKVNDKITIELHLDSRLLTNQSEYNIKTFNVTIDCKVQKAVINFEYYFDINLLPIIVQSNSEDKAKKFLDSDFYAAVCSAYNVNFVHNVSEHFATKETCNFDPMKKNSLFKVSDIEFDSGWTKESCDAIRASTVFFSMGLIDTAVKRTCVARKSQSRQKVQC